MQSAKQHKFLIPLVAILFLAIGIICGITIRDWPLLSLDTSVDLADVFGFIVGLATLIVAWYIAHAIDRQKRQEGYKIEFVIVKLKGIQSSIESTIKLMEINGCHLSSINSKLKLISMQYLDIKESCSICGMGLDERQDREILDLLKQIKRLSTESNRYKVGTNIIAFQSERELTINDNIVHFHEVRIDDIKTELNKLYNILFKYCLSL